MHLPLTTPFFPDGRLNLRKLEQNTARYSLTPAAGLVVLGPTGEASLLSDEETRQVLKTALESAASTKVLIAGASRNSLRGTLELIDNAALLGYDAILLSAPSLPGLTPEELRNHFQSIADKSLLPIILEGKFQPELVVELAFHHRILGLSSSFKDPKEIHFLLEKTAIVKRTITVTNVFAAFTGRMSSMKPSGLVSAESLAGGKTIAASSSHPAIKTREKSVSLQILAHNTETMLDDLKAGAVGAIPPFAAAAPQASYEVMAAWRDGDPALAEEKQHRIIDAIQLIEEKLGVAGLKYGCDLNGYFGGNPRLPLLPLSGNQRAEIERLMRTLT
ncbi:MAG: dihydrodipicolinate synthase family protein [Granulicella sp.]